MTKWRACMRSTTEGGCGGDTTRTKKRLMYNVTHVVRI